MSLSVHAALPWTACVSSLFSFRASVALPPEGTELLAVCSQYIRELSLSQERPRCWEAWKPASDVVAFWKFRRNKKRSCTHSPSRRLMEYGRVILYENSHSLLRCLFENMNMCPQAAASCRRRALD